MEASARAMAVAFKFDYKSTLERSPHSTRDTKAPTQTLGDKVVMTNDVRIRGLRAMRAMLAQRLMDAPTELIQRTGPRRPTSEPLGPWLAQHGLTWDDVEGGAPDMLDLRPQVSPPGNVLEPDVEVLDEDVPF
jgi:hypothetical protein